LQYGKFEEASTAATARICISVLEFDLFSRPSRASSIAKAPTRIVRSETLVVNRLRVGKVVESYASGLLFGDLPR